MSERRIILYGEEFDRLCNLRGWSTIRQRCEALEISPAQYSKVLAGVSNPGAKFIHNALAALEVPYSVLFGTCSESTAGVA